MSKRTIIHFCKMAKGVKGSGPTDEEKRERTSFNVAIKLSKKLRIIAANESTDMSAIVNELLDSYVTKYEKANGTIAIK